LKKCFWHILEPFMRIRLWQAAYNSKLSHTLEIARDVWGETRNQNGFQVVCRRRDAIYEITSTDASREELFAR
jgi:hypothetical protein